jgi:hypothetical protein
MAAANDILDRIQGALSICSVPWVKTPPSPARTASILQALCLGFAEGNLAVAVDPASAKAGFHLVAGYVSHCAGAADYPPVCGKGAFDYHGFLVRLSCLRVFLSLARQCGLSLTGVMPVQRAVGHV